MTSCYRLILLTGLLLAGAAAGGAQIQVLAVESATAKPGLPDAGSLATIYVTGLQGIQGVLTGSGVPLPTTLGGVRIAFGSVSAPLLAVVNIEDGGQSHQQINFQVPYVRDGNPLVLQGSQSAPIATSRGPWGQFFTTSFQHASDYRPVTFSDPPKAGEWIIVYGTNFGEVVNPPDSGFPAPADRLVPVSPNLPGGQLPWNFRLRLDTVTSEIPLEFGFMGLAPGKVGVYQINFRMPDPLPRGRAWIHLQRVGFCEIHKSAGCADNLEIDSTDWVLLYQ